MMAQGMRSARRWRRIAGEQVSSCRDINLMNVADRRAVLALRHQLRGADVLSQPGSRRLHVRALERALISTRGVPLIR